MSLDEQFTAKGPAAVGFQTRPNVTGIHRGVDVIGTELGVRGRGPSGVVGVGTTEEGVRGHGPLGVVGEGTRVGVVGVGLENGPGGKFLSNDFRAQINLAPHSVFVPAQPKPAAPREFDAPVGGKLPKVGRLGDLWAFVTDPEQGSQCFLWLCVSASIDGAGAKWAQVLLGTPITGTHPLPATL
jgi:hypothetical protein